MAVVLALDVGGTKLAAAVVDDAGRILGRGRVPSPTGTDPEPLYEALLACSAAGSTMGPAATPAMSATSSSSSTGRTAPAAAAVAWRRSRPGPTPCATPSTRAGAPRQESWPTGSPRPPRPRPGA